MVPAALDAACRRYGGQVVCVTPDAQNPTTARMGAERGQHDPWTPELVAMATEQRRKLLDLADWDERVRWRDEQLMRLRSVLES